MRMRIIGRFKAWRITRAKLRLLSAATAYSRSLGLHPFALDDVMNFVFSEGRRRVADSASVNHSRQKPTDLSRMADTGEKL